MEALDGEWEDNLANGLLAKMLKDWLEDEGDR